MKKLILILTVLSLLALLVGCDVEKLENELERAEDRIEDAPEIKPSATIISGEEAEDIALEHAGLSREQVKNIRTEYDVDDGRAEYDITFYEGNLEYEFEIHAESGEIISYDRESIYD